MKGSGHQAPKFSTVLRRLLAALTATVTVALTVPAAATATASGYRTSVAAVVVHDGPGGRHTATLDTRLYVPATATAAHPAPAVLMTHGFGSSKDAAEVTAQAGFLARHGYVVLTWTAQGFGGSSGCIQLDSYDYDVKDVEQLIAKLLEPRPDVARDRRGLVLGMVGGSYGGGITLNVAAVDHRLRAIVPARTWNDLFYSLDPNNLVTAHDPTGFSHDRNAQGVFKAEWTSLFVASGNAQPVGGLPPSGGPKGGCPQEKLASGDPTEVAGVPCLGFPAVLCQTYAEVASTGDLTAAGRAIVENSSVSSRLGHLTTPTLLLQGESDTLFNLDDAVATYTALRRRHVPVAMTWNSGGHGGYDSKPGECDVYGGGDSGLDSCYLTRRTLAWLDHWLRDRPLHDFPGFTYYRDWVRYSGTGPDTGQYGAAAAFPAEQPLTFTLSGSDRLVAPGHRAARGTATFVNPPGGEPASYSETSKFTAAGSTPDLSQVPPSDPPGEAVSFTSPPFTRAVVSVGVPAATLRLAHTNGGDLVFFGKVFDVAPDGSATLIHRLIAPVRVPAADVGQPVRVPAADVGQPVRLHLLGFAHRFGRGHRVRLTLAATDQTSYNAKTPDLISVRTGPGSTFALPVDRADAGAPSGTGTGVGGRPGSGARGSGAGMPLARTGTSATLPVIAAAVVLAGLASLRLRRRRPGRRAR